MKLARIVAIIMLLLQHKKMTAARLAEMFEVNIRTIYRDIETINLAGIPISTSTGAKGGISIMEEYKVEKGLFTASDITSLLIALGSSPLTNEELATTIAKIKGLAPEERMRNIEFKARQIVVDHRPWYGHRPLGTIFKEIKAALDGNCLASFQYYDGGGRESRRTVEPYQLMLKNSNWYLLAYCTLRQDFRLFRLSRMSELQVPGETFSPRNFEYEASDAPERPREITVRLLVDESLKGPMADFCGLKNLQPCGDSKILVDFPFIESDFGYGMLLGFGDKCQCLEPETVLQEIKRRAADLLALYSHDR
ncbi:MAG: YafY family transcriptional regulator [Candidatus Adiutrix sp.]|jgi:predicted DNA-binding transcriptional regulator YafY|nr:YafY family transcriptional regulator [Candidatus Adiutrix sp.]